MKKRLPVRVTFVDGLKWRRKVTVIDEEKGQMKIRVQTPLGKIELYSRRMPDGSTGWSQKPDFSKRVLSEKQQSHKARFQEASRYAREAANKLPIYMELAARSPGRNTYNLALSDWFHPPEIREVDLREWTGEAGEFIRVCAVDDVQVKGVHVTITDPNGTVLEQGPATLENYDWWIYQTTTTASDHAKVIVTAEDLPGHITEVVTPSAP